MRNEVGPLVKYILQEVIPSVFIVLGKCDLIKNPHGNAE
jgi:hypothetical protein